MAEGGMTRREVIGMLSVLPLRVIGEEGGAPTGGAVSAGGMAVVEKWVKRSAGVKTLVAAFRHERKLMTMRKPLESVGKLWYSAERGAFRLDSGDPVKFVAVVRGSGELTVMFPEKKEAEVMSGEAVERSELGQAMRFLTAGFPDSMETLRKRFEIVSVTAEGEWHRIELKPAGAVPGATVSGLYVQVETATGTPGAVHLNLRDGTRISNVFTKLEENVEIAAERFEPVLEGYKVRKK